ncbi:MAG TPA: DUF6191 domain-containing protein [Pseudonocardiaceae bacterium]
MLVLVAVGYAEMMLRRRRHRSGAPLTATYIDEFTAMFYGTKRAELEHRDSQSMMRDEDAQGARARVGIDLDTGTVVLNPSSVDDGKLS